MTVIELFSKLYRNRYGFDPGVGKDDYHRQKHPGVLDFFRLGIDHAHLIHARRDAELQALREAVELIAASALDMGTAYTVPKHCIDDAAALAARGGGEPVKSTPADLPEDFVLITIERAPRCHWHDNCTENSRGQGIMKAVKEFSDRIIYECLNCGVQGHFPVGHAFGTYRSPIEPPARGGGE